MHYFISIFIINKPPYATLILISLLLHCGPLHSKNLNEKNNDSIKWTLIGPGDADQITSLTILKNNNILAGTDIGGLYRSDNKGKTWQAINNGLQNLDITTPVIQNHAKTDILYVGTRGGLYKSKDQGSNWQRVNGGLPEEKKYTISGSIGSIALDPKNSDTLYLGLGYRPSYQGTTLVRRLKWSKYIYKSNDAGKSWQQITAFDKPTKIHQITISSSNSSVLFAATSNGLFTSKDSGESWKKILPHASFNILQSTKNSNILLVSCGDKGIYKSINGGKSWAVKNNGLSFMNFSKRFNNRYSVMALNQQSPKIVYVVNSTWGRSGGAYISNDFGEHWEKITDDMPESWLSTSKRMNTIAANKNNIFLGSSRYLYSSNDNGKTWKQRISKYVDNGWNHTGINVFGHTRTVLVDPVSPETYYTATADHGLVISTNSGTSWNAASNMNKSTSDVWDITYCKKQPEKIIAISSGLNKDLCLISSKDKGKSWELSCEKIGKTDRDEKILINPKNCNQIYIATKNGITYSDNNGRTWNKFSNGAPADKVYSISISSKNTNKIFAGSKSGLYISTNNGQSWKTDPFFNKRFVSSILISPYDDKFILVGTGNNKFSTGSIYKSTDAGKSWHAIIKNITSYVSAFSILPGNHNIIYATSMDQNFHDNSKGSGVFRSIDKGNNWQRVDEELPVSRAYNVTTSEKLPFNVFISAAGGGAYMATEKQ